MASKTITTPGTAPAVNATARPKGRRNRQIDEADVEIVPPVPPEPPQTAEERTASLEQLRRMQDLVARLRQSNLDTAVLLAQQAAAGNGPLVDHFCELGRRFAHELRAAPRSSRGGLKVIEGGAA